jgi:hypothetical protein
MNIQVLVQTASPADDHEALGDVPPQVKDPFS